MHLKRLAVSALVSIVSLAAAQAKDAGAPAPPRRTPARRRACWPCRRGHLQGRPDDAGSVLYDAETDTYLVSCINGAPLDKGTTTGTSPSSRPMARW